MSNETACERRVVFGITSFSRPITYPVFESPECLMVRKKGGSVNERMIGDPFLVPFSLDDNRRTCTDGHTRSTQDQNLLDFARFDPIGEFFQSSLFVVLVLFGALSAKMQKLANLISQLIHL